MKILAATMLIAASVAVFILYLMMPEQSRDIPTTPNAPETQQGTLPVEPVKKDLRDAGSGVVPSLRPKGDTVERLPAKPVTVTSRLRKAKPLKLVRPVVPVPGVLQSGTTSIGLARIAAIPLEQTCGLSRRPCGRQARTALRRFVRGRTTHCQAVPDSNPGIADCRIGTHDLSTWLVTHGWAEALPGSGLESLTAEAKSRKIGLWAE